MLGNLLCLFGFHDWKYVGLFTLVRPRRRSDDKEGKPIEIGVVAPGIGVYKKYRCARCPRETECRCEV